MIRYRGDLFNILFNLIGMIANVLVMICLTYVHRVHGAAQISPCPSITWTLS